jgi:hypothetical protein
MNLSGAVFIEINKGGAYFHQGYAVCAVNTSGAIEKNTHNRGSSRCIATELNSREPRAKAAIGEQATAARGAHTLVFIFCSMQTLIIPKHPGAAPAEM